MLFHSVFAIRKKKGSSFIELLTKDKIPKTDLLKNKQIYSVNEEQVLLINFRY